MAVQMRPKEGAESERGERDRGGEDGETRRGHTNRHSWDSETATRQLHRTTADRLERSQSARFDRAVTTTDTNNRFERLNPDTEAPGDAPRTGGTRSRKHNSRSASGSSYRSRSPKRKSGGKDQKSNHPPERGHKETTQTTNCELEWDSFATPTTLCQQQQQDGDDVHVAHNGAESQSPPVSTSPAAAAACDSKRTAKRTPEQTTVDKVSGASAQGGGSEVGERVQGTHDGDPAASGPTGDELGEKGGCSSDTETTTRLSYTRVSYVDMSMVWCSLAHRNDNVMYIMMLCVFSEFYFVLCCCLWFVDCLYIHVYTHVCICAKCVLGLWHRTRIKLTYHSYSCTVHIHV